jgi:hypothetical protein
MSLTWSAAFATVDSQNCEKKAQWRALFYDHSFAPNSMLQILFYVWQFLYTHSFTYQHRKKSGIVRSVYRTGYGIPDAWKRSSLLINKQHIPTIRCHRTDFEMAWHHPFLSVQTLTSTSIVLQTCFLKCVNRLSATLTNYCAESRGGEKRSFHASKVWSEKFKKQMSVHNLKGKVRSASAECVCVCH